ncbi:MAG TPA: PadR family transcriptional regulator [Spirochaetota bacterium]|jgi:DNA-binding PadR family transcriptional regulator|nr:PadR family transcriptional regulator [Spirochaetota bacterium]HON15725.1 PadR family transcriptional regulator [Spirochaetota bacterium]HOV09989.1 PadR family transcriptional regulator [Spirochaetota bacterium]
MKIEITILGLLMEGNLYGYEIKKKIVERLEDYVDIKFGSIYYAIKKSVDNGWVKRVGTEKESGNPERYVYEILPAGKKHYKRLLKQYFDTNFIHFDIDIVLMFLDYLSEEQKEQFYEERITLVKEKIDQIKKKIEETSAEDFSTRHILSYLEHHLNAELNWLQSTKQS